MGRELQVVRSRGNAALKRVREARSSRGPAAIVLEGPRLVRDALAAGHRLDLLLVREDRAELCAELGAGAADVRLVQADLFDRLSSLATSPGVLALGPVPRGPDLASLAVGPEALVVVVAGVADPGNLGALARSAEAAGAAALVVAPGGARPWNEKALRGSMGSLLRLPVVEAAADEVAAEMARRGVRQVAAATRGGTPFRAFDWSGPIALWIAGETGRMPEAARGFEALSVPMAGGVESLNVTVAASLLMFAAGRL